MKDKKFKADEAISTGLVKEDKSRRSTIHNKTKAAIKEQNESLNTFQISDETDLERLRSIPLRSDELFSFTVLFAPEVLQEMIRIVTGIDSPITATIAPQVRALLPEEKEIAKDCFVSNERGDQICISMRNYDDTALRFLVYGDAMHLSTLDKESHQNIVIVFQKDDIIQSEKYGNQIQFNSGCPYEKTESSLTIQNVTIDSGTTVYFVNGSYKNDDEVGQLIQSLSEPDPAEIQNPVIKKWMMDVKNPGGKYHMSLLEGIYGPEISKYYVPRTEHLENLAEKDLVIEGKDEEIAEKDLALEEKNQELEKLKSMFAALLAMQNPELNDLDQDKILAEFLSSSK